MRNKKGATAIEYGLIAAGISIAIIAVVNGLGTTLNEKFNSVSTQLHQHSTRLTKIRGRLSWRPLSFQTKRPMSQMGDFYNKIGA
jgi:pilus assembly protein Flp/PilA